jgi:HSP20 family protein
LEPERYSSSFSPAVNVKENDKEYEIELAVPGANKNDFKIEVNNDVSYCFC